MKKFIILSLLLLPFALKAQQEEYKLKGDEAMNRKEYGDAKYWYEEGVSYCDWHSINKLTEIWRLDPAMHTSMQVVMGRCLDCLKDRALTNDSLAIKQIIEYYAEGIGTAENEESANSWRERLEQLRRPVTNIYIPQGPKESMKFFAGYQTSPIAPFGIQVGGMGKSVGWYIRLRSNLSFQATQYDGEVMPFRGQNQLKIKQLDDEKAYYRATGRHKETTLIGSAGIMVKAATNFYVSAGAGYWDRKYAREFIKVSDNGADQPASVGWARDINSSTNGVTIDLDATYVISEKFYVSLGANLMNFNYVYPNIGVGIVF